MTFDRVFPYAPVPAGRPLPKRRALLELPGVGLRDLSLALDTGSNVSLIDGGRATLVDFDPPRGAQRVEPIRGVSGALVAYMHTVPCIIGPRSDPLRIRLEVGFSDPAAPPPPFNVLGRKGFLDAFAVVLENYLLPPRFYLALRGRPAWSGRL